jgi:N4-gp56 family major capsid protein
MIQKYSTTPSRNLIRAEMKFLKHAEPILVMCKFGEHKTQPLNKSDTVVFRRIVPFNANANEVPQITPGNFITAEGVTPAANTITWTDVTATLNQFAVLFKFSSKAEYLYEDDIPNDMAVVCGETMAEVAELICYGQNKAGTAVIYSNGTTRLGIATKVSINDFRLAARSMESNRGKFVNSAVTASEDFGTAPVERSYVVFVHTDLVADIRDISGFTKRVEYGTAITPVHEREIGAIEDFRIVTSPLFAPFLAAGAAVGTTGMLSAGSANVDVYPSLVMGQNAWGQVSLKGKGYSGVRPTIISSAEKNHANPNGMFGYVGADFWTASVRLNENWMNRIESGATDISG